MSNKPKETKMPTATLGTNNTATKGRNTLIGKVISLNQKLESYFGVGNIWLTSENYSTEVPDGLTDQEYEIIDKSLLDGTLVEGKKFIPPVDRSITVLDEYWADVKSTGLSDKTKLGQAARNKFSTLIKKTSDRGWTAYEIAAHCLNKETQGSSRENVIRLLKEVIDNYFGQKTLYKEPTN